MVNIMLFGGLTGGHFNPAVSTGVLISQGWRGIGKNLKFYFMIVMSEILGAFFGTFVICNTL
jgi:glycerol uptake facilitator-like aquaporin